jgi:phosphohistidine phosphatase SixA
VHILYLVRHADAGEKWRWSEADALRPLSPVGWRQAEALVARLHGHPVGRILSSPTARCRQTVEPLARQRGLPLEEVDELAVDADPAALLALTGRSGASDGDAATVLCTHGELISRLFDRLAAAGVRFPVAPTWPKGSTWILRHANGGLAVTGYLPPPSAS